MRKHVYILWLSLWLLAGKNLPAQTIEWLNPRPHGYDVLDIEFYDNQRGLMCGTFGSIYLTTDGGNTWSNVSVSENENLQQIIWFNGSEVLVAGKRSLYKSTDGGLNFSLIFSTNSFEFLRLSFPDNQNGYALVNTTGDQSSLASTSTGGYNWVLSSSTGAYVDLAFRSISEGILLTPNTVYRTTDGGQTLNAVYTEMLDRLWRSVVYAENDTWVAAGHTATGENSRYLRSTDNGINWQIIQGGVQNNLRIKRAPDGTLYSFGIVFHVYSHSCNIQLSTDMGLTWSVNYFDQLPGHSYLSANEIKAVGMINPDQGFAYTYQHLRDDEPDLQRANVLFRKNGNSWAVHDNNSFRSIYDVEWEENNTGWLGEYGFLAKSTDGGQSWSHLQHPINGFKEQTVFFRKPVSTSKSIALSKVLRNFNQSGFEAFELTSLYASNDGGNTWSAGLQAGLASPLNFDLFNSGKAYLFARNCGIVWKKSSKYYSKVCGKARLFVSDDFGTTWSEFQLPLDTMANMQFLNSDTGYIFGGGGTTAAGGFYMSEDQGRTWSFYNLNLPPIRMGQMLSGKLGFLASADTPGKVYWFNATTGSTDLIFECPANQTLSDIAFTSLYTGYVLCHRNDTAFIYSTLDGGVNWNLTGSFPYLKKLKVFSNLNGFAYGSAGRLLKLGAGYPVGIQVEKDNTIYSLKLNPNPADRYISVPLNPLTCQNSVKIEIIDAAGRLVTSKSIEHPASGQLIMDVSKLREGIYFLKVQSCNTIKAGKLIIQR